MGDVGRLSQDRGHVWSHQMEFLDLRLITPFWGHNASKVIGIENWDQISHVLTPL